MERRCCRSREILKSVKERILIWAPTGRDGALIAATLTDAKLDSRVCSTLSELRNSIEEGAGVVIVAQEGLGESAIAQLKETLLKQPAWSDLPVLVLVG